MRTETIEKTWYTFGELSEEAQEHAIEKLWDINVDYEWWECVYEDAREIGLEITGFDLYRNQIGGKLHKSVGEICELIISNHGWNCGTHNLARQYYRYRHSAKVERFTEEEFKHDLLEEYLSMLRQEREYLTSREAIIETIEVNKYEFDEDGNL